MGLKYGVTQLENLKGFRARQWFDKEFVKCGTRIAADYMTRNELVSGGIVSAGSGEDSAAGIYLDLTKVNSVILNGRLMKAINAQTNRELINSETTGSEEGHIGYAIYSDGTAAAGATLADGEDAFCTLIICNSDDDGGADENDNGQPAYVLVIGGTGTGSYDTSHLTSAEIRDALEASTAHAGVTGWVHVAQIEWTDTGGTTSLDVVNNRNNMISEA